ncbi:glycosyltransferase [Lachnospiraceae bacterium HCP28S3_F9]
MADIKELTGKTIKTLKEEGVSGVGRKAKNLIQSSIVAGKDAKNKVYRDVLFINGCDESVPHPARYRVTHQREQLEMNNISTNQIYYVNLQLDQVRFYRTFVFFRCPYTDMIGEFIKLAKKLNKKVLFDIDDLVVDTKYTDTIKYLDTMTKEERALYDDGVKRMGKTLSLCDAAITTTERLAFELNKYVPEVFINRNTASEEMCKLSQEALKNKKQDNTYIKIGYFSGSLTHNDDFLLILPTLVKLMKCYENVQLHVVGELDLPEELMPLRNRVVSHPFVDWKKLPELISEVDINLAPLEESIFNEAKSENKWVEAALVKVPTVASKVGAFDRMIEDGKTGYLCSNADDWEKILTLMIENEEERERIAENAYHYCMQECVTIYTGAPLRRFLKKYMTPNFAFVLPSMNISGGIMVALKHATMLQDAGYDVTLLNVDNKTTWCDYEEHQIPVLGQDGRFLTGRFDHAVATMWTTVAFLENYINIDKRYYLVQNYETDFYEFGNPLKGLANKNYFPRVQVEFLTISKWCQDWLKEKYGHEAKYVSNGIVKDNFKHKKRDFTDKIRILIEGDCAVYYKNVDESFKIVDKLDPEKYEIWYMSYNAKPKSNYRVDKFLHQIPYEKVPEVYQQCHILLKTSFLESFSYPPLEMMATGGYSVVVPNDGNKEYLVDGENCLLYPCGEIDRAVEAIERICSDEELREKLYVGGIKTAQSHDWDSLRNDIVSMYVD